MDCGFSGWTTRSNSNFSGSSFVWYLRYREQTAEVGCQARKERVEDPKE